MTLEELLDQLAGADVDTLATVAQHALQALIEAEATAQIGAAPNQRADSRKTHRNGHRPRSLDTRLGRLQLGIPKLRSGTFYPSLLEPRRRIERALLAVVQEAYVHGVSTRKVDDLVAALGGCSISKSEVSRICSELDGELEIFRERRLDDLAYPYLWIDATYQKVRQNGRIVSQATAIAIGVSETGEKSVLAVMIGASESAEFWLAFCRALVGRGLGGVQLVTSDAHEGLKAAIAQCFAAAGWQRCKVHFLRSATAGVPLTHQHAVTALLKGIFTQPTREAAQSAVSQALDILDRRYPKIADKLRQAEDDLLTFYAFPSSTAPPSPPPTRSSDSMPRSTDGLAWSASSPTRQPCSDWLPPSFRSSTTSGRTANVSSHRNRCASSSIPTRSLRSPIPSSKTSPLNSCP